MNQTTSWAPALVAVTAAAGPLLKSPARVAPAAVLGNSALMKSLARFAVVEAALAGAAPLKSSVRLATVASAMASAPAQRSALVAALKSCDGCPSRPPADWRALTHRNRIANQLLELLSWGLEAAVRSPSQSVAGENPILRCTRVYFRPSSAFTATRRPQLVVPARS